MLRGVDAVVVRVPSLDSGLAFYRDELGHEVVWRTDSMIGLRMPDGPTELVLSLSTGPETDLLVESVNAAVERVVAAGGSVVVPPADIPVGSVAVVRDPFGNDLTLVDLSKGTYETDADGYVTAVRPPEAEPPARSGDPRGERPSDPPRPSPDRARSCHPEDREP